MNIRQQRSRRRTTAIFLVACLAASACGSSDDADGDAEAGEGSETTNAEGPATSASETTAADGSADTSSSGGESEAPAELGSLRFGYGAPLATSPGGAPFAVAEALGFWEEQGLDVTIYGLQGSTAAVQALITDNLDASVSGVSSMLSGVADGNPQPIQSFYSWIAKPTYSIAVLADSPIQDLSELEGLEVGVKSLAEDDAVAAREILAAAQGVDPAEIRLLPVGEAGPAAEVLRSGRITAYAGGDSQSAAIKALGLDIRELPLPESLANATDTVFVTTPEFLATNSAELAAFGRGFAQAVVFCSANITACIEVYWSQYPEARPPDADTDFEAASAPARAILETRLPKTRASYEEHGEWGYQTDEGLMAMAEFLGITNIEPSQFSTLYTNELTTAMSDFDVDEYRKMGEDFPTTN